MEYDECIKKLLIDLAKVPSVALEDVSCFALPRLQENTMNAMGGDKSQIYNNIDKSDVTAVKGKAKVDVGIYTERIVPKNNTFGIYHSYKSLGGNTSFGGRSMSDWVVGWFEYGVEPQQGHTYRGNQPIGGRKMIYHTIQDVDGVLPSLLQDSLDKIFY